MDQNEAYQLLIQEYIETPTEEQINLFSYLFEEWCKSGRSNLLHHMFEIMTSHESQKVRHLVVEKLRDTYPDESKSDIIELWITHPVPLLDDIIRDFLNKFTFDTPLKAAALVMLDDFHGLQEIDPDFHHLDLYLRDIDPLLGSLLIQRVEKIKSSEYQTQLEDEAEGEQSLIDRIRKREYNYLWENILEFPLPFIVELFKYFDEDDWEPVDTSGLELFDILREQFGTKGWSELEHCKWVVVSKKIDGKFHPLSQIDVEHGGLQLRISQDLIIRPDRIRNQKFQSRGRFNLTDPSLGLHIYLESVRRSDFDGLLHIPIYSSNGVELAEFAISTNSEKNFAMDEDGMYFTVQTKYDFYSLDLDALAAFLLPISRHSSIINEIIPILLERVNERQKLGISGLNLLSVLHKGREFTLWDLKDSKEWDDDQRTNLEDGCHCTLAIDVGNSMTKLVQVVKGSCEHEMKTWEIPTIIYYSRPNQYIVGKEVFDRHLQYTSQTFSNIKRAIGDHTQYLRIQNEQISAYQAFQDFLARILEDIRQELPKEVQSIAMTYPINAPSGFEAWLREILDTMFFPEVELIDEISAAIIGTYRLDNYRGNILVVDIGSTNTNVGIATLHPPKSRKRLEDAKIREDFDGKPEIVVKQTIDKAGLDISEYLHTMLKCDIEFEDMFFEFEDMKHLLQDEKIDKISLSGNYSPLKTDSELKSLYEAFEKSSNFHAFRILLRNSLIVADSRKVPKTSIEKILVTGDAAQWCPFSQYLAEIFPDADIVYEPDKFIIAKGVGLLANGQKLLNNLDNDYMLKVAKNGIVGYQDILSRGEKPFGQSKRFEIRSNEYIDKLVVDCWTRSPHFIDDENVQPIKDKNLQDHLRETRKKFKYERIFRKIIDIKGDMELGVNVSSRGTLYIELVGETTTLVPTDTSVL